MEKRPDFRIDPEFANKIPPIGEAEFNQLRENIMAAGEVYEPLVIWNGILVDGHNRWKIIQEAKGVKWRTRELSAPDKWAAFEWMYKNQLGRRNLTDEQRTYTIGKMYEARKNTQGGDRRSKDFSSAHNGHLKNEVAATDKIGHGVSGEIATELNIGRNTVRRAEHFSKGIDTLRDILPAAADKVLRGEATVTKADVASIAKMEREKAEAAAVNIIKGIPIAEPPKAAPEPPSPTYGIDGLIEIIEVNGAKYISALKASIETRRFVVSSDADKERLHGAIEAIINEIKKVRATI